MEIKFIDALENFLKQPQNDISRIILEDYIKIIKEEIISDENLKIKFKCEDKDKNKDEKIKEKLKMTIKLIKEF